LISERHQIAERFLSEGHGEAARIRGLADAKAAKLYARAYNRSPEAVAFYEVTRTMQAYTSIIGENTTLVLSTDSDLFKFLKGMGPEGDAVPVQGAGAHR
jgi:membrane protease subunit HflC